MARTLESTRARKDQDSGDGGEQATCHSGVLSGPGGWSHHEQRVSATLSTMNASHHGPSLSAASGAPKHNSAGSGVPLFSTLRVINVLCVTRAASLDAGDEGEPS